MKKLNIKINNKELNLSQKTLALTAFIAISVILNGVLAYKLVQSNLLLNKYSHIAQKLVGHVEDINIKLTQQEIKIKQLSQNICK